MSSQNKPGFVTLPDGAPESMRKTLRLRSGEKPRISYLSVASDMVKSLEAWQRYGADPEVPKATFGHMFFEMIARFDAEGRCFRWGAKASPGQFVWTLFRPFTLADGDTTAKAWRRRFP